MDTVAAAGEGRSLTPTVPARGGDTEAVIDAKQARSDAQARVDADRRAHSPGCVAVDEKGLQKADAQLSAAQVQAQQTQPSSGGGTQLSIQV